MSVCKIDAGAERFRIEMADIRVCFCRGRLNVQRYRLHLLRTTPQKLQLWRGFFSYAKE